MIFSFFSVLARKISHFFQKFLDFFFPTQCVICGENLENAENICEKCLFDQKISLKKVKFGESFSLLWVTSFFRYSDAWVKAIIRKGKYSYSPKIFSLIPFFVSEKLSQDSDFSEISREIFPENSLLIPVPLHYFRFQKRGFNQAQIIAEAFSKISGNLVVSLIKRVRHTPHQARFSREDRLKNLKNAFRVDSEISQKIPFDTPLVLVDDVVSTASTLLEIQKILREAGYTDISAVTLARGGS